MSKKTLFTLIVLIILLGGAAYYYFFIYASQPLQLTTAPTPTTPSKEFTPVNPNEPVAQLNTDEQGTTTYAQEQQSMPQTLPILRQLTTTPIAGYMASSTASSTIIRYVDRGVGHIYEASASQT